MQQQINLYQPIFRKEQKLLSLDTVLLISAIVFACLALLYVYSHWQTGKMKTNLSSLQKLHDHQIKKLEELTKSRSSADSVSKFEQELKRLQLELVARQRISAQLQRINNTYSRGFSRYLEGLARQTLRGVWLTRIQIADGGESLDLKGSSTRPGLVPVFVQKLSAEPSFSGTRFNVMEILREKPKQSLLDFRLFTGNRMRTGAMP